MDERFVRRLLVPSCIIVILSSVFFYELKYLIDVTFFKKKHILVIGILSAPENFEQRLSIRKTWLQLLSEVSGSAYFIIGKEACPVPVIDRSDPYSCIDMPFFLPPNATADTEFSSMKLQCKDQKSKPNHPGFIGFGFYVRHSIVIKSLGILTDFLEHFTENEVQVKLVSAFDNKVLASVTFSKDLLSETNSRVVTKVIKPVLLVTNYEVFVKLDLQNTKNKRLFYPSCDYALWRNEPNVISFVYLWQEDSVIPQRYTPKSCSFVTMTYSIMDVNELQNYIQNRPLRLKDWQRLIRKQSNELKNESKIFNDIMFVNVLDVYRNLSLKIVQFLKRALETEYFHYILKTDDDSFIDLLRVYHQLKVVNKKIDDEIAQNLGRNKDPSIVTRLRLSKFFLWSSYKEFWKVQRSGKWRDDLYQSASYPTFPCGGGYVINKGIVEYIVSNEQNLNHFQGEDVSIGIWLSSLPVIQYKPLKLINELNSSHSIQKKIVTKYQSKKSWAECKHEKVKPDVCEWICSNVTNHPVPVCNRVQLSVQDMYRVWKEYSYNGFLYLRFFWF